jgi:orotate phosphoribosyltransferase
LDLDAQISTPSERRRLVSAAIRELRQGEPPDMLVSSGTEALVLTSILAAELGLPMAYLRPKPKSHGRQQRVEGELRGAIALVAVEPTSETIEDNEELVAGSGARISRVLAVGASEGNGVNVVSLPSGIGSTRTANAAHETTGSAESIARVLLDIGSVIIRSEPFRYASGLLSPIYTDCRLLISHPDRWPTIIDSFAEQLHGGEPFDAIAGVATSGIPHASVLAQRLDKPLVYAAGDRIMGTVAKGDRLIVIEDLVTTGKSVLEAAAVLREHGLIANRCLAIFTYNRQQPSLAAAGISFDPLSDLDTLLPLGVREKYFGEAERQAVLDWRHDPQGWTARHEPAGQKGAHGGGGLHPKSS